jgi:hypothetical protein
MKGVLAMTNRQFNWLSFAVLVLTMLCIAFALLPTPRARARPQHIQSVNHLAGSSLKLPAITLPVTNATPER